MTSGFKNGIETRILPLSEFLRCLIQWGELFRFPKGGAPLLPSTLPSQWGSSFITFPNGGAFITFPNWGALSLPSPMGELFRYFPQGRCSVRTLPRYLPQLGSSFVTFPNGGGGALSLLSPMGSSFRTFPNGRAPSLPSSMLLHYLPQGELQWKSLEKKENKKMKQRHLFLPIEHILNRESRNPFNFTLV
jgi:hypothetical protein